MITSSIIPYEVPFAKPITLGGRDFSVRRGALLRLGLRGAVGWGECAPLPGFSDETHDAALADLRRAATELAKGSSPTPRTPSAACALDAAFQGLCQSLDDETREASAELANHGYARHPHRGSQSVNAVLLEAEPPEQARQLYEEGYRAIKLKVGGDPGRDARRVLEVAETGAKLRLDANRAWTVAQARDFFSALGPARIQYIEEPVSSLEGSRQLALEGVPVALDESLKGMAMREIELLDWPVALVLKPMILGGIRRCRAIAEAALNAGIIPVVSSSIETGVGLSALALFAASLGTIDVPAGLGTSRLLGAVTIAPAFAGGPEMAVGEPFTVLLT
jgi:O-succinylbenzoate synthase